MATKRFTLEIKTPGGVVLPIRGEFSGDAWRRIQEFTDYARELGELPLLSETGRWQDISIRIGTTENPAKLKDFKKGEGIKLAGGGPITVDESRLPPKEEVDAVLHRLRPFIFQKKPDDRRTFFPGILKLVAREISCTMIFDPLRARFTARHTADMMQLRVTTGDGETRELISDQAVNDWLNAFEFHRNAKKASQFKEIPSDHITPIAVRALMLELVAEKATAILRLSLITESIERGEDFGFLLHDPNPDRRRSSTVRLRP